MAFPQQNPTLDRIAARLELAGAGDLGPVLAGFRGLFTFTFHVGESLTSARIYTDDGFEQVLSPVVVGNTAVVEVLYGTDTDSGVAAVRNFIEWTTNLGVSRRQFWVKDAPTTGGVYIHNQEAQAGEALLYANVGDADPYCRNVSFSINLLPTFNDEFFTQHEYSGNRYANTRRNWGGAETVEVFLDSDPTPIIAETPIEDVDGYYYAPAVYGAHTLTCTLRAALGSGTTVDLTGNFRVRQIPCPS